MSLSNNDALSFPVSSDCFLSVRFKIKLESSIRFSAQIYSGYNQVLLMFSMSSLFCTTWITVMIVSLQMHGSTSCIESERKGLLDLKASLNNTIEYNWPNETHSNCCKWEGLQCDITSGHVISLFLTHTLNLDPLPLNLSLFHPFGELQNLNLSSFRCAYWFDDIHGYKSLGRLKRLEVLDFRYTNANSSVLPFLNAASSLKTLILRGNYLEGSFQIKELNNLRNLQLLDLSWNWLSGPLIGLDTFRRLQYLDLSDNEFSGSLEDKGLCKLKKLRELDLSQNQFVDQIPKCFESLTHLRVIDVSSNQLNGTIPSFTRSVDSIEYLSLSNNEFEGFFSFKLIANLWKLKVFKLSSRSSLLQVKTDISLQPRFQLRVIELQNCNLEAVPSFLQHQKKLRLIDLSHNKLTKSVPTWLLVQIPKLEILLLQNNSLTKFQLSGLLHSLKVLDVSANELNGLLPKNFGKVYPNLRHLNVSNNWYHGNLPSSLGELNMLDYLDLSRNNLSGNLPKKFLMGCKSLRYLRVSYNKFTGQIFSEPSNLQYLSYLFADNNKFSSISVGLQRSDSLAVLDLSSNDLHGVIPSWLGDLFLTYIFLSNNLLEGTVPRNLFNVSAVMLMDLSRNKLSGNLPTHCSCELQCMLFLNDNEFSGAIPDTLLGNITVLDVRNNYLSGSIPRFVSPQNIQYLLLRGNRLTGYIPKDLCNLSTIKILDLANNRLNGSIPSCLNNISFGRRADDDDYGYTVAIGYPYEGGSESYSGSHLDLRNVFDPEYLSYLNFVFEFASKRRYDSYNERSFNYIFGMDLSENELSGEIPKELGDLQRIRALNLSHNSLSGQIPKSFSNLTDTESIDLSYNKLHGSFPHDLTKLHGLVTFNVSYNDLSGSIPSKGKFLTLDETNYIANPLLCGLPLNRRCDNDISEPEIQSKDNGTTIDMESFYWSLVATYSVTWIAFIVFICFDTSWRQAWFRLIDAFINLF